MSIGKILVTLFGLAGILLLSSPSFAAVLIDLKNGNEITAEECHDDGATLTCYKMGGSFLIDKGDIRSVRKTKTRVASPAGEAETAVPSSEKGEKTDAVAPAEGTREEGKSEGGTDAAKKRFDEIHARKVELSKEREKLVAERQKLEKDYKDLPDWMTTDQYKDITGRIADLDEKVKRFNEEVKRLDAEEKEIIGGGSKKEEKGPTQAP